MYLHQISSRAYTNWQSMMNSQRFMPTSLLSALIVCLFQVSVIVTHASAKDVYYLGFLSPFPSPNRDSLIPVQLAQQWQSAFQVALEVLNSEDRAYELEAVLADTSCSWMKVLSLSHVLDQKNLIGVVGPACSGAALSASQYFEQETPFVSFAATHDALSSRNNYPNFFRTVYGDKHQTQAVLSVMENLDIWNAIIICAKDYYSLSLGSSIQQLAGQRVLGMKVLDITENSSIQASQIKEILGGLNASNVVILALPPSIAKDFWTVAMDVKKASFPWWYLGTDGVTALDPFIDGSLELAQAVQGEIGLAPQGGDATTFSECKKFLDYWKAKAYPGLPSPDFDSSRAYVTHLIDTVAVYFEIVDALVKSNIPVNSSAVLAALQGLGTASPNFKGCTGVVQIDPETGSRKVSSSQPAMYDFVSWVNTSWKLTGRVHDGKFVSLQSLVRPVVMPQPADLHQKTATSSGLIAGAVFFSVVLVALITILVFHFSKKNSQTRRFVRLTH